MIIEENTKNMIMMDEKSKLMQSRILFIDDVIDDYLTSQIIAGLLYLDSVNNKEITIFINSPGGQVYSGLGIIDAMRRVKSPIKTVVIGVAASMAAVILTYGDKRQATKYSTIMFHEPSGGVGGQYTDVKLAAEEMLRVKKILNEIIDEKTNIRGVVGHDNFEDYLTRDKWLDPSEAKKLEIIDDVL